MNIDINLNDSDICAIVITLVSIAIFVVVIPLANDYLDKKCKKNK